MFAANLLFSTVYSEPQRYCFLTTPVAGSQHSQMTKGDETPRVMDLGLLARALRDRQIDLAAGNNTDGLIPALDLFVLEDDRHYFPPYEAVPVIREQTLQQHPEVARALAGLAGKISDEEMQRLNYAVDGQHRDAKEVAREFLRKQGLIQ